MFRDNLTPLQLYSSCQVILKTMMPSSWLKGTKLDKIFGLRPSNYPAIATLTASPLTVQFNIIIITLFKNFSNLTLVVTEVWGALKNTGQGKVKYPKWSKPSSGLFPTIKQWLVYSVSSWATHNLRLFQHPCLYHHYNNLTHIIYCSTILPENS